MDNQNQQNQNTNFGEVKINTENTANNMINNNQTNQIKEVESTPKNIFNVNKYINVLKNMWIKLDPQLRKILAITGFIFGLLLIMAVILSVSTKGSRTRDVIPNSESDIEQSPLPEIIINPSRYATDSAVLLIEENIKKIEKEIGETVISDLKLAQPNLLWEINFED